MRSFSRITALCIILILGVSLLVLGPSLLGAVRASESQEGLGPQGAPPLSSSPVGGKEWGVGELPLPSPPVGGREGGQVIGLASSALECLAVGSDLAGQASGVVGLTWQGQFDSWPWR